MYFKILLLLGPSIRFILVEGPDGLFQVGLKKNHGSWRRRSFDVDRFTQIMPIMHEALLARILVTIKVFDSFEFIFRGVLEFVYRCGQNRFGEHCTRSCFSICRKLTVFCGYIDERQRCMKMSFHQTLAKAISQFLQKILNVTHWIC